MVGQRWLPKTRGGEVLKTMDEKCPIYYLDTQEQLVKPRSIVKRVHFIHICKPERTGHLSLSSSSSSSKNKSSNSTLTSEVQESLLVPISIPLPEDIPREHLDTIINDPYTMTAEDDDVLEEIRGKYEHREKSYSARSGPAPEPEETYVDDHKTDRCHISNLKKIGRNIIPDYTDAKVVHNYKHCKYFMLNLYDFVDDESNDPSEEDDEEDPND